jgi:serine/threonine protein kinase
MVAPDRRYWILEVVGTGSFGSVYKAELQGRGGFRKKVALKMLHPDRTSSPEILRRLRDEARLLAHVSHPGIVQVDGLIKLRGQWTVVMEFVHGVSLREIVASGPVPMHCAVELVELIAEAMDAAHTATDGERHLALVHRDIKPSNILLSAKGAVKLVDFGVAMADPELREARTDDLFFGAPEYMAPERWEFLDTPAADVYSLGAVFWELITGELLGRTTASEAKHDAMVEDRIEQLEQLDNAEVSELIRSMLLFDPSQRPTARQVATVCRELIPSARGPWLRDWAEREVPRCLNRRPEQSDDPLLDAILSESDGAEITTILPQTHGQGTQRFTQVAALLAVFLFAGLTLWIVQATTAMREASSHTSGLIRAPSRPDPAPVEPEQQATNPVSDEPALATAPLDEPPSPGAGGTPRPARASVTAPRPDESSPFASTSPFGAPTQATTPQPGRATVRTSGDASEVFLVANGVEHRAGAVPAGSYVIKARFGDRGLVEAGRVELSPGASVTINCDSGFAMCKAQ